jgi:hypothetical protein
MSCAFGALERGQRQKQEQPQVLRLRVRKVRERFAQDEEFCSKATAKAAAKVP